MRRALLLLVSLVVVGGCGNHEVIVGGTPRKTKMSTVVSLSPSTTEIIMMLDSTKKLVGRTAADNYPTIVSNVAVVAGVKPDYERIALIAPDYIVMDGDLYSDADRRKLADLHVPIFEFKGNTIAEFLASMRDYSAEYGGEVTISEYVDKITSLVQTSQGESPSPRPKVAMLMVGGPGAENYAAGTKSFQGDVLKVAGGDPVGPATTNFAAYPAERMIQDNPDIIFVVGKVDDAQKLLSDPKFKTIKAVANRHISVANPDIATRKGDRIDTFISDIHKKIKEFVQK